MRIMQLIVLLMQVLLFALVPFEAGATSTCPAGKITCAEWCMRYNASSSTCMAGHPNSCDKSWEELRPAFWTSPEPA